MDTHDILSPMREESKKSKQRVDKKRRPTVVEAEVDSVYDDYDVPTPSTPPPPPPPDDDAEGVPAKTASSIPLVQMPNKNTSSNRLAADSHAPLGDTAGTTSKTEGEEKGIVAAPLSASDDASDSLKTSKKSSSSSRAKSGSRASSSKSKRATESALSVDATPPSPPQSEPDQAPISEETKRSNQRLMILKEIFNSEKDYVDQVRDTIETFLIPLRAANFADNISREIPVIFGNIELIQSVNSSLLQRLDERASVVEIDAGNDPNVSSFAFTVGDIFLEMSNNLLCYDQYCTNHKKSVEALQRAEKHQIFKEELEKCRNRNVMRGRLQHLNDLLIKPIQRICKYPLLFKELLKVTPESHPDFRPLEEALHRLGEIALQINESNAIAENVQKLEDLQKRIDGLDFRLAEPPRHFVLEGDLQKVNPRGKVQTRYFLLMSDMLIWTAAKPMKKNHYQFKGQLRLDLAIVRDTPDTEKIKNKFEIIKLDTKKIYVLVAESPELKKKWMAAIEVIINSYLEAEKIKDKQIQIQMARMGNSPRSKPGSSPAISRDQPTRFSPISKATSVSSHEVSALVRQSLAPSAPLSSSGSSPVSSPLLSAVVAPGSPLRPDLQSTSSSGGVATESSDFENYDDQQQRQHQDDRIIAEMAVQIDVLLKGFREMQNLLSQSQQAQQALEERVAVLEKVIEKQQQKKKQSRKTSDPIPPKQ